MSDREPIALLAEAVLDPVLRAGVFARGDGRDAPADAAPDDVVDPATSPWPAPTRSVQLLWCASFADVREQLPGLYRQVRRHEPEGGGGCADLVVDLDVLGRLVAADVEAEPLAELLQGVGEPEAAAAAAELPGLAAEVAVPALADLLERLLLAAREA
jgi:hypothetical protein